MQEYDNISTRKHLLLMCIVPVINTNLDVRNKLKGHMQIQTFRKRRQ